MGRSAPPGPSHRSAGHVRAAQARAGCVGAAGAVGDSCCARGASRRAGCRCSPPAHRPTALMACVLPGLLMPPAQRGYQYTSASVPAGSATEAAALLVAVMDIGCAAGAAAGSALMPVLLPTGPAAACLVLLAARTGRRPAPAAASPPAHRCDARPRPERRWRARSPPEVRTRRRHGGRGTVSQRHRSPQQHGWTEASPATLFRPAFGGRRTVPAGCGEAPEQVPGARAALRRGWPVSTPKRRRVCQYRGQQETTERSLSASRFTTGGRRQGGGRRCGGSGWSPSSRWWHCSPGRWSSFRHDAGPER